MVLLPGINAGPITEEKRPVSGGQVRHREFRATTIGTWRNVLRPERELVGAIWFVLDLFWVRRFCSSGYRRMVSLRSKECSFISAAAAASRLRSATLAMVSVGLALGAVGMVAEFVSLAPVLMGLASVWASLVGSMGLMP